MFELDAINVNWVEYRFPFLALFSFTVAKNIKKSTEFAALDLGFIHCDII